MIDFNFYLITDRTQCASASLEAHIEKACEAGLKAVQLREKDLSDRELLELADTLRKITSPYGTKIFINGRTDVACLADADGVHLPEDEISPEEVNSIDSSLMIGASVHSLEAAKQAEQNGADFVLFGPIFESPSKTGEQSPHGLVALQEITEFMKIPVFAVGGVSTDNAARCIEYKADGVAGISSVIRAENPAKVIQSYKKILGRL